MIGNMFTSVPPGSSNRVISVGRNASESVARLAKEHNIVMTEQEGPPLTIHTSERFNFRAVTCEDVQRIISSLPLNESPGVDKLNARIFKDSLLVILGPLTDVINSSLSTCSFPTAWKEAEVGPILKKGDHEVASNNRPLSLLPVAAKVCEKIFLEQFSKYLIINNRLSPQQSGNKKSHSTETLDIYITDCMLDAMDKKKISALILLDLSKAFDSINHDKLLHKLSSVGASAAVVNWFKSYLTGRVKRVRIGSTLSDPLLITHGVLQGAILSPLLFCIYVNDLPHAPKDCRLESFVDDSKVLLSFPLKEIETASRKIEKDLHKVATRCCQNNLLINPEKTKFLLVGTRQLMDKMPTFPSLSFLGKTLKPVDSAKDLGVIPDLHLTYTSHISNLFSTCISKLCQISRVKQSFDKDTPILMITSLVFNKLFYCSCAWSNTSAANIKKLQLVQNFASKIVTGTREFDHVTPLLRQLKWLRVEQILYPGGAVMAYKCINGLAPSYLLNKITRRTQIHNRHTRNRNSLQIPLFKTATGQRTFTYRMASIWNNLSENLKQSASLNIFKQRLTEHLLTIN